MSACVWVCLRFGNSTIGYFWQTISQLKFNEASFNIEQILDNIQFIKQYYLRCIVVIQPKGKYQWIK